MSSEFRSLWDRREELLSLAKDLSGRKFAVFNIVNFTLKKDILSEMIRENQMGNIVMTICDGMNWGWAGQFTDYRFIVPPNVNKVKYARLAQMLLKRMTREE